MEQFHCKFAVGDGVKPDLEKVLHCASEIQAASEALKDHRSNPHDPVALAIWELDWITQLRRELGGES
jgi:hypothetical protein